uniref:28S ribosomal protein S17, mitochondrial n=1 Tax=Strigamia maritima TaxID=126957 RepID=T1IZ82_STRMM
MPPTNKLLVIGQCVATSLKNAVKVSFRTQELDENLFMYFQKKRVLYAHDENKVCKLGDIVLIKQLAQQWTKEITHEVVKVVFPLGDVIDPLTGKKSIGPIYEEHLDRRIRSLGQEVTGYLKYKDEQQKKISDN